jgi:HlyD family secretion protein
MGGALLIFTGCSKTTPATAVSGTIETDEARLASRYGGRVSNITVTEGDAVKGGQVIIELEATELEARRREAAATLAELEAGPRREELEMAKHDWEALEAELAYARLEERRITGLFEQRAVSEMERDRAQSRARNLDRTSAAAKSRYELLVAGTRVEKIEQARAQLALVETQLRETQIIVPTNAILETLSVKAGDVVAPNQPAATVLYTDHLWVRVYVPEPWLGHIHPNDAVSVKVDSFPAEKFQGVVEQIQRAAEFTPRNAQTTQERIKRVFGVKVRLPIRTGKLRAGMAADVTFNIPSGTPR